MEQDVQNTAEEMLEETVVPIDEADALGASEQLSMADVHENVEEMPSDRICDLVDFIISGIVDYPESLELDVVDEAKSTSIEIHAHPDDVGKIIGKQGRTIKSIRTLARALGARLDLGVDVEVVG